MSFIKIPTLAYFGTEQKPMTYALLCDQGLFDKFKAMQLNPPPSPTLYRVQGPEANKPVQIINDWFGTQMLSGQLPFYVGLKGDEPSDYTDFLDLYASIGIAPTIIAPSNNNLTITKCYSVNGTEIKNCRLGGFSQSLGITNRCNMYYGMYGYNYTYAIPGDDNNLFNIDIQFPILPGNIFKNNRIDDALLDDLSAHGDIPTIEIYMRFDNDMLCYDLIISGVYRTPASTLKTNFEDFSTKGALIEEIDTYDPYGYDGTSSEGGGDGTLGSGGLDSIDPAEIPGLPGISAANLGFITMYNPTAAQLKNLSDFLWSNLFDLNTYKKLFSDPMQSIIGLAIVPVAPSIGGSKTVKFGTIDSNVSMPYLSTNYVQLDCGSVSVEKYVGCFMDNDPYTKISIYLPFIGIRQLSADDIIGGSIHVVYNIDVLTGACACFIEHSTRGVLYSYNGSCITNVPLTAVNFSGAIQNAVTAVGSMIGIAAGMTSGAAPITAMSAAGLMTSAANTALNSKPSVQRSGNLGGSAGILSIMTPYVIIERPNLSVPNNVQHYVGQTSNITMRLYNCHGFTLCDYVHIDNVSATTEEIAEIESLLKQGVIL